MTNVCVCLGILWFLDEAGFEVIAAASGASQEEVLLVYQAVQQVFLPVVVIHLQERHRRDPQPGEPSSPQSKLWGRVLSLLENATHSPCNGVE